MRKICEFVESAQWYAEMTYGDVTPLTDYTDIVALPPAESVPALREKYQIALDEYNRYYNR